MSYEMSEFTVDLGVTNLFDKDYYNGCSKGEGRVITLGLTRDV